MAEQPQQNNIMVPVIESAKMVKEKLFTTSEEEKEMLRNIITFSLPTQSLKIIVLILNIIPYTAGFGTVLISLFGSITPKVTLAIGFLQWCLNFKFLYVGWIWSMAWAILAFMSNPGAIPTTQEG
jgi:hypothetical protein